MLFSTLKSNPPHQVSADRPSSSLLAAQCFPYLGVWVFSLVLLLSTHAFATAVKLAWDPVSDSDLAGYKVYYGYGSRQYSTHVTVGKNTEASMSGLKDAKIYYFAVTAYDVSGNESGYSNEV